MPHVIIKMYPGRSEDQKTQLADAIVKDVMAFAKVGDDAVSVAIEEVTPGDWTEKVYKPDILNSPGKLYKKPGYNPLPLGDDDPADAFGSGDPNSRHCERSAPELIANLALLAAEFLARRLCGNVILPGDGASARHAISLPSRFSAPLCPFAGSL